VKRIMEDHASMGAKLSVEHADGGGASFKVTLVNLSPSPAPPQGGTGGPAGQPSAS